MTKCILSVAPFIGVLSYNRSHLLQSLMYYPCNGICQQSCIYFIKKIQFVGLQRCISSESVPMFLLLNIGWKIIAYYFHTFTVKLSAMWWNCLTGFEFQSYLHCLSSAIFGCCGPWDFHLKKKIIPMYEWLWMCNMHYIVYKLLDLSCLWR